MKQQSRKQDGRAREGQLGWDFTRTQSRGAVETAGESGGRPDGGGRSCHGIPLRPVHTRDLLWPRTNRYHLTTICFIYTHLHDHAAAVTSELSPRCGPTHWHIFQRTAICFTKRRCTRAPRQQPGPFKRASSGHDHDGSDWVRGETEEGVGTVSYTDFFSHRGAGPVNLGGAQVRLSVHAWTTSSCPVRMSSLYSIMSMSSPTWVSVAGTASAAAEAVAPPPGAK